MKVRSFAKINLGIEVLRKRKDNYHDIRTLFQTIDLFDDLELQTSFDGRIELSGDDPSIPWDERNLIFQAAHELKTVRHVEAGVSIEVIKRIPAGKGLGGGSSNAAMTLHALNELWELGLSESELREAAGRLGADVPYFLEGGLCLGEGRGDVLTPLPDLPPFYCVLVLPPFPISTADVYGRFSLTSPDKASKMNEFLAQREFGRLENRLEETVFSLYPRLKAYKDFFREREAALSLVSGSGSAVFGLYRERRKAEQALLELEETVETLLVETLSRERYWKRVKAGV